MSRTSPSRRVWRPCLAVRPRPAQHGVSECPDEKDLGRIKTPIPRGLVRAFARPGGPRRPRFRSALHMHGHTHARAWPSARARSLRRCCSRTCPDPMGERAHHVVPSCRACWIPRCFSVFTLPAPVTVALAPSPTPPPRSSQATPRPRATPSFTALLASSLAAPGICGVFRREVWTAR